jgi:hypothetical protein
VKTKLILLSVLLVIAFAHAADKPKSFASRTAGTAWDTLTTGRSLSTLTPITIENNSITYTDTLWCAFNNDTVTFKLYLLPGNKYNGSQYAKTINTRSGSGNTIPRQVLVR